MSNVPHRVAVIGLAHMHVNKLMLRSAERAVGGSRRYRVGRAQSVVAIHARAHTLAVAQSEIGIRISASHVVAPDRF